MNSLAILQSFAVLRSKWVAHALMVPLTAMLLTGCEEEPELATQPEIHLESSSDVVPSDGRGPEDLLNTLAAQFPEFSGIYRERTADVWVVTFTDRDTGLTGEPLIRTLLESRGYQVDEIRVHEVDFTFHELDVWRNRAIRSIDEDIYTIDLDEVGNQVRIGVPNSGVGNDVRLAARELSIPDAALSIYEAPRPTTRATLRDRHRPIHSGAQLGWDNGTACTVWQVAQWAYSSEYEGFLTASHCSQQPYGMDPTDPMDPEPTNFFQPTVSFFNQVGYEFDDPDPFTGDVCPGSDALNSCRWADILFVRYHPSQNIPYQKDTLFRPTGSPAYGGPGSITISGTFDLHDAGAGAVVGTEIQKVGRTSGWTYGFIESTCVDIWSGLHDETGRKVWIKCNIIADLWSEGGDSGGPVFFWPNKDTRNVHMEGLLWGGPANDHSTTYYSTCYNIGKEMYSYDMAC